MLSDSYPDLSVRRQFIFQIIKSILIIKGDLLMINSKLYSAGQFQECGEKFLLLSSPSVSSAEWLNETKVVQIF